MRKKVPLTVEAFNRACRENRYLTVEAFRNDIKLAVAGEVVSMSPCGCMCEIAFGDEFVEAPVSECVIIA